VQADEENQPTLLDLHACPTCEGSGSVHDPELGERRPCRVCKASGTVPYDPADKTIPY